MIRTHDKARSNKNAVINTQQINEVALTERWGREDLWADLAGEEIDEDVSFTLEVFDDLLEDRPFND